MTISDRDRAVVTTVARFKQVTTAQIRELVFPDKPSRTNCDRSLQRLVKQEMLHRVEQQRLIGGSRGGAGQYAYALGRMAWTDYFPDRWRPPRRIDPHAITIAECYLVIKRLADQGQLSILGMSTEPDSWEQIGVYELRPDLLLDIQQNSGARRFIWLEVDLGTEGRQHLKRKMMAYYQAREYNKYRRDEANDPSALKRFPAVLFVVPDEARRREVLWVLGQLDESVRRIIKVTVQAALGQVVAG